MIDINSILTQALAAAVAEATKPLVERIAALETRLLTLENNPAQGVDTTLETRLLALEKHTAVLDQHGGILEYLDNQEWFWEKVRRFADGAIDIKIEEAIDEHNERTSHYDQDDIETWIDAAIEQHEENRTHGDDDDIEEIVQKLLNSASISITV
jgi:hypothetical protein